jgi:PHD/YefM family antitoxin component YafN of YafNO toxin-antitoxin module
MALAGSSTLRAQPVAVAKHGRVVVVMAVEEYERLTRDSKFNAATSTGKEQ